MLHSMALGYHLSPVLGSSPTKKRHCLDMTIVVHWDINSLSDNSSEQT